MITGVHMGGVNGLVLTSEDSGYLGAQTAEDHICCIHNVPAVLNGFALCHIGLHGDSSELKYNQSCCLGLRLAGLVPHFTQWHLTIIAKQAWIVKGKCTNSGKNSVFFIYVHNGFGFRAHSFHGKEGKSNAAIHLLLSAAGASASDRLSGHTGAPVQKGSPA